jgi:hypothetical protein
MADLENLLAVRDNESPPVFIRTDYGINNGKIGFTLHAQRGM